MFFDLAILEFEDLEAVGEGTLSGFGFGKVVDLLLVGVSLFNVVVFKVDDCVAIWKTFSADSITKNDFFLAINICPLNFSIISHNLILNSGIIRILSAMILISELHFIIIITLFLITLSIILYVLILVHLPTVTGALLVTVRV